MKRHSGTTGWRAPNIATPISVAKSFTMARTGIIGPSVDNYDVRLRTHTLNFGLAYKFN